MYDGVLKLKLSNGVEFADDVVLTITGETAVAVEMLMVELINMIETWTAEVTLQLIHLKRR